MKEKYLNGKCYEKASVFYPKLMDLIKKNGGKFIDGWIAIQRDCNDKGAKMCSIYTIDELLQKTLKKHQDNKESNDYEQLLDNLPIKFVLDCEAYFVDNPLLKNKSK